MEAVARYIDTCIARDRWQARLLQGWSSIVGDIARYVLIGNINGSTLLLIAESSAWIQEIFLMKKIIIDKINLFLGEVYVTDFSLKSKIFNKDNVKKNNEHVISKVLDTIEYDFSSHEMYALQNVQDTELVDYLKKFRIRCICIQGIGGR